MRGTRHRTRAIVLLAAGLALTGVSLAAWAGDALRRPELDTVDLRFSVRGTEPRPADLAVVAIDGRTFSELRLRWPFPRSVHARAIGRLKRGGARVIAYDVQFTEPSEDPREDLALLDAVARAGNVILGTTEVRADGETNVLGGGANLRRAHARAANANLPSDPGGVIRRLPYSIDRLETFPVVVAEAAGAPRARRSDFPGRGAWIDYLGPPGTVETVSFSRLVRGRTEPGAFRGKIVVIGASAPTLQDVHPTPTSGDGEMAGPEIQAQAISTVLRGLPLGGAPGWLNGAAIVLLGMLAPLAGARLSPPRALALSVAAGAAWLVAAQLAFEAGTIVALTYPLAALALGTVGALGVNYLFEVQERMLTRATFARFVPEQVVEGVLKRAGEDLRLGGERLEATVMFSDLRGFTSFSEELPAEQVIELLNRYLTEMSEAILAGGGTIVSYMGDGIMAIFGAPIPSPDHADRALAAAGEMLSARLPRFNGWIREQGLGEGFRMGIGLNTGPVMSGNVGSERRLEYTAVGDTTNVASRLEGMTKGTPHQLFIAGSTRAALTAEPGGLVRVGELAVRGREAPIEVWALGE